MMSMDTEFNLNEYLESDTFKAKPFYEKMKVVSAIYQFYSHKIQQELLKAQTTSKQTNGI